MDLVFLHGAAASGKLTTARALAAVTGYPVFHNHLVVDALTTVFPFGSEPFARLREAWWLDVFRDAARHGRSLVFTFTPEPTVSPGFPDDVSAAVEPHGGAVRFVRLEVSESEQERRIGNPDRRQHHKLTDLATLRRLRAEAVAGGNGAGAPAPLPATISIQTDTSTAQESARTIVAALRLRAQAPTTRYPTS